MKKVLSIILLISMLMSMVLVIPSSALSQTEKNVVTKKSATIYYVGNSSSQKNYTQRAVDGVKKHEHSSEPSFFQATAKAVDSKKMPKPYYDINGKTTGDVKYTSIVGWELDQTCIVNTVRVYLDEVAANGTPCKFMVDGFDVAVSETGEDGSWQIVYSGTNIQCERKYQIYPEGGIDTAYVEATFNPTAVKYFQICITVPSCTHCGNTLENKGFNTTSIKNARFTEIELIGYPAFNPKDYTNLLSGAVVDSYQFPTAGGLKNATDGVISHNHNDASTYLSLATPTYTKDKIYNINGNAGTDYVGYVTYQLRASEQLEAIRVYLDEVVDGKACESMLDGMDIAVSDTGKPGSWKIVYSQNNINADKKYQVYKAADGSQTAFVEALFDPIKANYVRIAISDTGCEEVTQDDNSLRSCRITEVQAWTAAQVSIDGEIVESTGVNSLMLFPLLMRHRQYETETTTTMFGLRVKHLLRSADAITFEKNGVKVDIPAATLKALNLAGSDKLVVTITGTDAENAKVTVTVNGEAVDIEGIASSTPEDEEPEVKGTTYRWDFNDLNEANGLNNLTDSAKSTKGYTFEDGMIKIADRTTDFELAETISLTPWADWSIEWKAQLSANSALFGTAASEQNFIYLAYGVSSWSFPFRMVDANNKVLTVKYGDYASLNTEMNTWKAEFSSDENRLTLKFFNEESQEWEVVGAGTPPAFNFDLTHMFGRHGSTDVCLQGQVDYIEVFVGE